MATVPRPTRRYLPRPVRRSVGPAGNSRDEPDHATLAVERSRLGTGAHAGRWRDASFEGDQGLGP